MNEINVKSKNSLAMSITEVANELHISRAAAYSLARTEGFPTFYVGKRILVSRAGLEKWMNSQIGGAVS